jgi:1-aminocyclopropane-1-carboxylate deaminase/D-cysteine desulfhydrase-like pyridoxal-dependent ACC family enzyme
MVIEPAPWLSAELGLNLSIKHDDLTGLAFGGNKTRQQEF